MFYLKDVVAKEKLVNLIDLLILADDGMYETSVNDITKRLGNTFQDEQYLKRVSESRQRWMDSDIHEITSGILTFVEKLEYTE